MSFGRWSRLVGQATYLDARDASNNTASNGKQIPFHARYRGYLRPELARVPLPAGLELGAYADAELRMRAYSDPANLEDMQTRLLLGCGVSVTWPQRAAAGDGQRGQSHRHPRGRRHRLVAARSVGVLRARLRANRRRRRHGLGSFNPRYGQ